MPQKGAKREYQGYEYTFDGTNWVRGAQTAPASDPIERRYNADTRAAEARADKAEAALAGQPSAEDIAKQREAAQAKGFDTINDLLRKIEIARKRLTPFSTGLAGQIGQHMWGSDSNSLHGALTAVLSPQVIDTLGQMKAQSKTGASGFGALNKSELELLQSINGSLSQDQDPEAIRSSLDQIERTYRRALVRMSGLDPDTPEGAHMSGLGPASSEPTYAGQQPDVVNNIKAIPDPQVRALNSTIQQMLEAGRSADDIRAFADQVEPGLGARLQNVDEAVQWYRSGRAERFGPAGVDVERYFVPKQGLEKTLSEASDSATGTYFMSAGDALSGGYLDNLTGDPALARAAMAKGSRENPKASIAGMLTGGGLAGGGIEGLLARYGIPASALATDAIMGAMYGSGSADEGDRLTGGLLGAGLGMGGGAVTRRALRGTGRVLSGAQNAAADYLTSRGVPLSTGTILGGGAKVAEDKLTSLPGVGPAISARRRDSIEGFNRAAFDEALQPVGGSTDGVIGEEGVAAAQELVGNAYTQAIGDLTLQADQPFMHGVFGQARADLLRTPRVGQELAGQVDEILNEAFQNGTVSGPDLQGALRQLHELRAGYRTDPQFARRIAPRIAAVENELEGLVERQAPPGRLEAFRNANEAYKRISVLGDAVLNAGENQNGVFSPSKLGQYSRSSGIKFGGRNAARRGERPFRQLIRHGGSAIPSRVPDSGTAGRLMLPAIAGIVTGGGNYLSGGNGEGEGEQRDAVGSALLGAGAAATLAAPYSALGQRAIQSVLTGNRPRLSRSLGDLIQNYIANPVSHGVGERASGSYIDRVPKGGKESDIQVNDKAVARARSVAPKTADPNTVPLVHLGPQASPDSGNVDLGADRYYDPETDQVYVPSMDAWVPRAQLEDAR